LTKPSVKAAEPAEEANLMVVDGSDQQPAYDLMSLIRAYLDNQPLSDDTTEIERVTHKSRMYHLVDGVLYRQGANGMMMRCFPKKKGFSYFRIFTAESARHTHHGALSLEKHSGIDSTGRQPRMMRWKSTKCKDCQFFQKQTTKHANPLHPIDLS
jgi:hypothetical protein